MAVSLDCAMGEEVQCILLIFLKGYLEPTQSLVVELAWRLERLSLRRL